MIGHVARLSPEKDQGTFLEAFSKVAGEIDEARLVIVGDGPLNESLQFTAYSLQLKDKVLFLGARNDIPELMNMFDVFMVGFGLVVGVTMIIIGLFLMREENECAKRS